MLVGEQHLVQVVEPDLVHAGVAGVCAVSTPVVIQATFGIVVVLGPPKRQGLVPGVHDGNAQLLHDGAGDSVAPAALQHHLHAAGRFLPHVPSRPEALFPLKALPACHASTWK